MLRLMFRVMLAEIGMLVMALASPLTGEMLNAQGNMTTREAAATISPKFLSLGKTAKTVTNETETAATGHKFKKTSHGITTKMMIVITELNGKVLTASTVGESVGGLVLGGFYWAHEVSANEFAIAWTKAQAESATEGEWVEYTAAIKTTTKFAVVEEATVTARVEAKWNAAANVTNELEKAVTIESNANSQEITFLLGYSASSGGTICLCQPAEEPFRTLQKGDKYEVPTAGSKISQTGFVI